MSRTLSKINRHNVNSTKKLFKKIEDARELIPTSFLNLSIGNRHAMSVKYDKFISFLGNVVPK